VRNERLLDVVFQNAGREKIAAFSLPFLSGLLSEEGIVPRFNEIVNVPGGS